MTFHTDFALAAPECVLAISALMLLVWGAFQGKTGSLFTGAAVAANVAAPARTAGKCCQIFTGGLAR